MWLKTGISYLSLWDLVKVHRALQNCQILLKFIWLKDKNAHRDILLEITEVEIFLGIEHFLKNSLSHMYSFIRTN